ncbi:uncharacterized protein GGS22DRAFT_196495 [Annulohypoxylon maeteangense]|uniref:uncharacterized protein n=1 Tax=Annulohypoxylon maeteangense TaxID=1927788 RepID=UPI002008D320|nr:uncharacterized protein GGS22DRAFT_196495 [Annulohypoxylon maeteangense]KAI0881579.1 hypothetical protein GGS22DRAFT_196495 [Annulohypoxylon maeteangense]
MAYSNSNESASWPSWLMACVRCFPKEKPKAPTYPEFATVSYDNAALGPLPFMMKPIPGRTVRSSDRNPRIEYDTSGQGSITSQPQQIQYFSANQSQSTLARPTTASSATTAYQRFPVNTGNVYGADNKDPRERWSKAYLTPRQFAELLDNIHATLAHVPYAICGLAALNDYGYTTRRLNSVSLLCPAYAKDNVRGWLKTKGYETYGDFFGIPIGDRGYGGEGATIYGVRVKWVNDEGFAWLEKVKSNVSNAWVLGLEAQIDYCAMGFVEQFRKLEAMTANGESVDKGSQAVARGESRLRMAAQDIFWCLDKAARTRHVLNHKYLPTLLNEEFWVPFTDRFDDARTEMARAGIDVAAVLAKHRDRKAVRDHEAILRQFGLGKEGVVTQQPSPYEGMRTLANSKSVYSLQPGSVSPVPPALPQPNPAYLGQKTKSLTRASSGTGKKDGLFTGLMGKRGGSAREKERAKFPKISEPLERGRELTLPRSQSVRGPPRDPALVPLPRQSAEIERPNPGWV